MPPTMNPAIPGPEAHARLMAAYPDYQRYEAVPEPGRYPMFAVKDTASGKLLPRNTTLWGVQVRGVHDFRAGAEQAAATLNQAWRTSLAAEGGGTR